MKYISVAEMAKRWNIAERTVRSYCLQGRIPDAFLTGKTWNIPETTAPERVQEEIQKLLKNYNESKIK